MKNPSKSHLVKIIFVFAALGFAVLARAADPSELSSDIYSVQGHNYTSKAAAIRAIVAMGKRVNVLHTRCEILTNKLTFKACPKNKQNSFENEQFENLNRQAQ